VVKTFIKLGFFQIPVRHINAQSEFEVAQSEFEVAQSEFEVALMRENTTKKTPFRLTASKVTAFFKKKSRLYR